MEVAILKQRLLHNHLPKSFESLQIPASIELNKINDPKLRQQFSEKCKKILQRTKSDMMIVNVAIAEAKVKELTEKFDKDMHDMRDNQLIAASHQRFSQQMMSIMEQRFKILNERLLCLYKLKLRFFELAPMAKN